MIGCAALSSVPLESGRERPAAHAQRARTGDCARGARDRARGYPGLDLEPYLQRLERMGEAAAARLHARRESNVDAQIATLNAYLFEELGFTGNREHYDDPRNSFLNEVLDRRTGIPISLAVVYLEVDDVPVCASKV